MENTRQVRQPVALREINTVHFPGVKMVQETSPVRGRKRRDFNFPPVHSKNEQECP